MGESTVPGGRRAERGVAALEQLPRTEGHALAAHPWGIADDGVEAAAGLAVPEMDVEGEERQRVVGQAATHLEELAAPAPPLAHAPDRCPVATSALPEEIAPRRRRGVRQSR